MKKNMLLGLMLFASASSMAVTDTKLHFIGEITENFMVRWAIQDMCDHVFDPRTSKSEIQYAWPTTDKKGGATFNPKDVKAGDTVFVRDVDYFFKTIGRKIKKPFIMVTHGEFRDTTQDHHLDYLDDERIIAWFAIHPSKRGHEKYYPMPLGIMQEKKYYKDKANFSRFLTALREKPKTKMLYMNFDATQNKERKKLKKQFIDESYCFNRPEAISFTGYMEEMADFKFALSPRGWGPDCYRTWEALFVGTIPIVRRGVADMIVFPKDNNRSARRTYDYQLEELYDGMPILIIDDWSEVTEEFLERKYKEITAKSYDVSRMYTEYWRKKIQEVRNEYLYPQKALGSSAPEHVVYRSPKIKYGVARTHEQSRQHETYKSQLGQDKYLNKKIFRDKRNGVFVDIGAHDGVTYSNSWFYEKKLGWKGICIEPMPHAFAQLKKARDCICINGAIAAKPGTAKFRLIEGPIEMLSGLELNYEKQHINKIESELGTDSKYSFIDVQCFVLNDLLAKYGFNYIDFLSLDIEGGELDVLKSINFERFYIYAITVENNYNSPDIREFLESKGFRFLRRLEVDELYVNTRAYEASR